MIRKIPKFFILIICVMLLFGCTENQGQTCTLKTVRQASSNLNPVSSIHPDENWPSDAAIVVQNNYAYVGVGNKLAVLEVSDPSNPKRIEELLLPNNANWISFAGNYIFVSDNNWPRKSSIVNISDPENLVLTECEGGLSLSLARAAEIQNYVLAPLQEGGALKIYEIASDIEKTRLIEVASYQSSVPPSVHLLPQPRITATEPMTVTDVTVVGQYAYIAENLWNGESYYKGRVSIFEASEPAALEFVADYIMPNDGSAFRIFADNTSLMIANASQEGGYAAIILDITNPMEPEEINVITGLEVPLAVHDDFAYFNRVLDGIATIRVRPLSDPAKIIQSDWPVSEYGWVFGWSGDMTINNNHAYLLDAGLLHIVKVADPFSPQEIATINVFDK